MNTSRKIDDGTVEIPQKKKQPKPTKSSVMQDNDIDITKVFTNFSQPLVSSTAFGDIMFMDKTPTEEEIERSNIALMKLRVQYDLVRG